jgi:hypothetical protein
MGPKILGPKFSNLKTHIFYVDWVSSDTVEILWISAVQFRRKSYITNIILARFSNGHNFFIDWPILKIPSDLQAGAQPVLREKYRKN